MVEDIIYFRACYKPPMIINMKSGSYCEPYTKEQMEKLLSVIKNRGRCSRQLS